MITIKLKIGDNLTQEISKTKKLLKDKNPNQNQDAELKFQLEIEDAHTPEIPFNNQTDEKITKIKISIGVDDSQAETFLKENKFEFRVCKLLRDAEESLKVTYANYIKKLKTDVIWELLKKGTQLNKEFFCDVHDLNVSREYNDMCDRWWSTPQGEQGKGQNQKAYFGSYNHSKTVKRIRNL